LRNYFNAANVENFDRKNWYTPYRCFSFFEESDFDQNQFFGDVQTILPTKNIISTNRELSDVEISIDKTSAHINSIIGGIFVPLNSRPQKGAENINWLNSAYILQNDNAFAATVKRLEKSNFG